MVTSDKRLKEIDVVLCMMMCVIKTGKDWATKKCCVLVALSIVLAYGSVASGVCAGGGCPDASSTGEGFEVCILMSPF